MLASTQEHPPSHAAGAETWTIQHATAGQKIAAQDLRRALSHKEPLILLFGEEGCGKTTLLDSLFGVGSADEHRVLRLSPTGGDFTRLPDFDDLLEACCHRLGAPHSARTRPEALAFLSAALNSLSSGDQPLLLIVDQADHLTDDVIADLAQVPQYLGVSPDVLLLVFAGSMTLASRIDAVLRRLLFEERLVEIRLSSPSSDEMAALLAYEDSSQSGGPKLTAGALERITAYAKSNLHWAAIMADAARALAETEGKREITAEFIRTALLDIWTPESLPGKPSASAEAIHPGSATPDVGGQGAHIGLSESTARVPDLDTTEKSHAGEDLQRRARRRLQPAAPQLDPPQRRLAERMVPFAALWLFLIATVAMVMNEPTVHDEQQLTPAADTRAPQPSSAAETLDTSVEAGQRQPLEQSPALSPASTDTARKPEETSPDALQIPAATAEGTAASPAAEQYGPWPLFPSEPVSPATSASGPTGPEVAPSATSASPAQADKGAGASRPRRAKAPKTPEQRPDGDKWIQTR